MDLLRPDGGGTVHSSPATRLCADVQDVGLSARSSSVHRLVGSHRRQPDRRRADGQRDRIAPCHRRPACVLLLVEMIIDFHNHFYPAAYLDALRSGSSRVQVTIDDEGNPRLHYPGDYNIAVRGHRDIDYRAAVMAEMRVDTQVLSLTTPGTHVEEPAVAVKLAHLVNDGFAEIVRKYPGRFVGIGTLPLSDPAGSATELERICRQLGFCGAMVFSNINGVALSDQR